MDSVQLQFMVTYKPHNHKLFKNPYAYETKHIYSNRLGTRIWVLRFELWTQSMSGFNLATEKDWLAQTT
jgi:hypothetical protein